MAGPLADNLQRVRERICRAAERAGRKVDDVTLVTVTKTIPAERIIEALSQGVTDIGENRVKEAQEKKPAIDRPATWHMIGHLQSRQVRDAVGIFDMVHAVDRLSIAEELEKRCAAVGKIMPVLIEVNVSGEASKFGAKPQDVETLIIAISAFGHLRIEGLMTMAPLESDVERTRPVFRKLKQLADEIAKRKIPGVGMGHLSMGMSNDFEVAVEEGATMVRIGTAIFAGG